MSGEPTFSRSLLIGWIAGAIAAFALALYFMGSGEHGTTVGPSTFSRSAIGHAGIAEVLTELGIPVVKSRSDSLQKLARGSVLVIAEPVHNAQNEAAIKAMSNASAILLVLPKWSGLPSEEKSGWLRRALEHPASDAQWALGLIAPGGEVTRSSSAVAWTTNALGITPVLELPVQLMQSNRLQPIIAAKEGLLVGELHDLKRKIWVLADPDVIANHGLSHPDNAALAVALIKALRSAEGSVVFDETVHGFVVRPVGGFPLLFRFPFVVATLQALVAAILLLWATLGRFGAPRVAPVALSTGREGLLQNIAKLTEFTGHQDVMVKRYVQETVRDVAATLHAPRGLSGTDLMAWLQRVGLARGVTIDCEAALASAAESNVAGRPNLSALVRLARDIHQWKGEIVDGRPRHPGDH